MSRLLLLLLLFFPSIAFATEYRIAVLDFRGVGVDDEAILGSLSDSVRAGLVKTIDTEEYLVMTRESTMQILKDMGKDASCMEGSCEVEVARNIGADYVVSGTVTLISDTYLVTLKFHNTQTNALLSSEQIENKDALTLVKQMGGAGQQLLYEGGIGVKPANFQKGFSGAIEDWDASSVSGIIVQFDSEPDGEGAVVLVDGKMVCSRTPCSRSIPAGEHSISIQKEHYQIWSETRTIVEGADIFASLSPDFGLLSVGVDADYDVQFLLNDEVIWAPIEEEQLEKGEYTLKIDDECYLGAKGEQYQFEVGIQTHEDIEFPVTPRLAGIEVSVQDGAGNDLIAKLYVDGEYIGDSPNRFTVPACSDILEVKHKGQEDYVYLDLKEKSIESVEIKLGEESRDEDFYDQPAWNFIFGYKSGEYQFQQDENLTLDNGSIIFDSGTEVSAASIPMQPFFDRRNGGGFQVQVGANNQFWYGNVLVGFLFYPEDRVYALSSTSGESLPLVLDFGTIDLGLEGGYIAPFSMIRPMVGLTAGVDLFTGNIIEVSSNSKWIEEGVGPYTLVSTQTTSEGDKITPQFQKFLPYVGGTTGLIIQRPEWPAGVSFSSSWKMNDIGSYSAFGMSFFIQVPMEN